MKRMFLLFFMVTVWARGASALAHLKRPVAMTWSEPSSGNANGSGAQLFATAQGIKRGIKIVGVVMHAGLRHGQHEPADAV